MLNSVLFRYLQVSFDLIQLYGNGQAFMTKSRTLNNLKRIGNNTRREELRRKIIECSFNKSKTKIKNRIVLTCGFLSVYFNFRHLDQIQVFHHMKQLLLLH